MMGKKTNLKAYQTKIIRKINNKIKNQQKKLNSLYQRKYKKSQIKWIQAKYYLLRLLTT
mgnify:CR=1 FL=1|jgi:hypothetical protein